MKDLFPEQPGEGGGSASPKGEKQTFVAYHPKLKQLFGTIPQAGLHMPRITTLCKLLDPPCTLMDLEFDKTECIMSQLYGACYTGCTFKHPAAQMPDTKAEKLVANLKPGVDKIILSGGRKRKADNL